MLANAGGVFQGFNPFGLFLIPTIRLGIESRFFFALTHHALREKMSRYCNVKERNIFCSRMWWATAMFGMVHWVPTPDTVKIVDF
jgi:hypothetical protein